MVTFKQFLAEKDILIFEEFINNLRYPEDTLRENLYRLYEIEYKYSMIKNNYSQIAQRNPRRADNLLNILKRGAANTAQDIAQRLEPIYSKWLENHALDDPHAWARSRTDKFFDERGYSPLRVVKIGMQDVEDYSSEVGAGGSIPYNYLMDHLGGMSESKLKNEFPALYKTGKTMMEERAQFNDTQPQADMSVPEFLAEDMSDFGVAEWFEGIDFSYVSGVSARDVARELYAALTFPAWYSYWQRKGIDETREAVEDAYSTLQEFQDGYWTPDTVGTGFFQEMNRLIQVTHQTGSLIEDYVEQYGGEEIGYEYFDTLSNLDPDAEGWNEELRDIGINIDSITNIDVGYDYQEPPMMR